MASSCHRLMATSCARDFQNNIRAEPVQDSTASTSIRPSLIGCTTGAPHLSTKASFFSKKTLMKIYQDLLNGGDTPAQVMKT